jgi:hypothetical protein
MRHIRSTRVSETPLQATKQNNFWSTRVYFSILVALVKAGTASQPGASDLETCLLASLNGLISFFSMIQYDYIQWLYSKDQSPIAHYNKLASHN